jgi:hypothetical protein
MARASDMAMLERQTLTSASVVSGVFSPASLGFDGRRVTFGRARGGSDKHSADASVAFEHGAECTRPRLSMRQTRAREALDTSVAEEVNHWISVAGTLGTRRSDGHNCAVSVAPEKCPVGFQ